jgi:hypothetical protein
MYIKRKRGGEICNSAESRTAVEFTLQEININTSEICRIWEEQILKIFIFFGVRN